MSIILAEKSDDKKILHPIILKIVNNDSNKYLSMPTGPTNEIDKQKIFSKTHDEIRTDYEKIFFSNDYFFTAIFNCNTFEEKIQLLNEILNSDYSKQTVGLILERMIQTITSTNDKKIDDLVKIYKKYYKKFDNQDISYGELYDKVKNML